MYSKAMFAKQFKELIDKRGLTQRAVAERINTTETTISRYVSGGRTSRPLWSWPLYWA